MIVPLILDPYVCLAASYGDDDCAGFLAYITKKKEYIRFLLDKDDQAIISAYEDLLNRTDVNPDQRSWLNWFLTDHEIELDELPTPITKQEWDLLEKEKCTTPVEPHLIALTARPHTGAFLTVAGKAAPLPEECNRGIHHTATINALRSCKRFAKLDVYETLHAQRAIKDYIKNRAPYPATYNELRSFLEKHDYRESETLEFKQPGFHDSKGDCCLTWSILEESMQEICALANAYGGKVIIGIDEKTKHIGTLEGFSPKHRLKKVEKRDLAKVKPKTEEEIKNMIANDEGLLRKFTPSLTGAIRYNTIRLPLNRLVIVFHIDCPSEELQFRYGAKVFVRVGSSTRDVTKEGSLWISRS